MSDDGIDADRVVVHETRTVEVDPDEVDEAWLDEHTDADYAGAFERRHQDYLGEIGEVPANYVCPSCGEGCWTRKAVDGTSHYIHYDNTDCERHYDATPSTTASAESDSVSTKRALANLTIGGVVSIGAIVLAIRTVNGAGLTVNGETIAVGEIAGMFSLMVVLATVVTILVFVSVVPRTSRGGGL